MNLAVIVNTLRSGRGAVTNVVTKSESSDMEGVWRGGGKILSGGPKDGLANHLEPQDG